MKAIYLQCPMGAAGDMIAASLASLLPDPWEFERAVNDMGLAGVETRLEAASSGGMAGLRAVVTVHGVEEDDAAAGRGHHHHHAHRSLSDIHALIDSLAAPDEVKAFAKQVYDDMAKAEAAVHGTAPGEVHFHEVGALDAVCDVVSTGLLMHWLSPDIVVSTPICVGRGLTYGAHGFMSVPAPATSRLLEGIPSYGSDFDGELCTPTGAALLRRIVTSFGSMPAMTPVRSGCGVGKRVFPQANCLRATLGEITETGAGAARGADSRDSVVELAANIDDMTAEDLAFARDELIAAGALDAWLTPIVMKKGRMATMISALCRPEDGEKIARLFLLHTTTLGVRFSTRDRIVLGRENRILKSPLGTVSAKVSSGMGVTREKAEFDDLARIARERGLPLSEVRKSFT